MPLLTYFKNQHDELLDIVEELSGKLSEEVIINSADEIVGIISQFNHKLITHLTIEDNGLYPKLLASSNAEISEIARDFMGEMGGLKQVVYNYIFSWSIAVDINADPQKFIEDSNLIISALRIRIEKENSILFPLVDKS